MRVNFYTPRVSKDKFSGGILCILSHANMLAKKGYQVCVLPAHGSELPDWIEMTANFVMHHAPLGRIRRYGRKLYGRDIIKSNKMQKSEAEYYQYTLAPPADIHLATHWETAECLLGVDGIRRAYFMQHFEPIFELPGSLRWHRSCLTYSYPIHKIANSSWCKRVVEKYMASQGLAQNVYVAINALDQNIFYPSPVIKNANRPLRVISYGGRDAVWKGFEKMARAVAAVRKTLGDDAFEWCVYGDAMLPPINNVANYTYLGFYSLINLPRLIAIRTFY